MFFQLTWFSENLRMNYHQLANNHGYKKKWHTSPPGYILAHPHALDPFTAQHSEHDHERVEKGDKTPARQFTVPNVFVVNVRLTECLLTNHCQYENDDCFFIL